VVGALDALPYAVSKGAVAQMTRFMALDHAHENIRVNAVCPGILRWSAGWKKGYFEESDPGNTGAGPVRVRCVIP